MSDAPPLRRAVFLDRDGTLIHDPGYLDDPDGVALLDGVADALAAVRRAGFVLVVVTNQSGIARGRYTVERYEEVAARLDDILRRAGVEIEASYYCPFHPDGAVVPFNCEHEDRKPHPGMWLRAAEDLGLDLARSYSIGDGERDVVAGKRAGTIAILLGGGRDKWPLPVDGPYDPDFVARDMREAVIWILMREGRDLPSRPGLPLAP
ncbi:MAG: D-glycero-alpha-D-manno-heptose-1,7-bisphosphate 7-phosphatase [Planctomycetota bacterium]|jgi:D-glycero-D-manno-heptose 1,7-bisphosphate phosphatase